MIGIPSYKATGGCGCGGGLSASPCGCGSGECASCQGQGIVRPRFFAGQLLTEDDLQLLTDYVGHKNRLHNRHLYGEGVVCGLEVTCHPCGDGRVIVHPGYALDCCGNDLTLACAATLDINAMVRDLRRDQLGGYDCGDPCPEPGTDTRIQPHQDPAANATGQGGVVPPPPQPFRYCLYLRYCEQASDPVMPYSTGEDCGRIACEATRIQEGVKFELRCRPMADAANPLIERLCACIGDIGQLRRALEALDMLDGRTVLAQAALESDDKVFGEAHIAELRNADEDLRRQITNLQAQRGTSSQVPGALIESVRKAALLINPYNALSRETQEALETKNPGLSDVTVRTRMNISQAVAFAATDSVDYFNQVRDWLIERLSNAPFQTDCTLRQKVYTMALPVFDQGNQNTAKIIAGGNQQLIEAFINFLRDCACRVMNPACMPCDDAGVLLACLEVEDCKVVKVCNLERTFVLSPAAVRYWLPPVQLLGNLIERLCCDPLESLLRRTDKNSNLNLGNLDIAKLLTGEVRRILEDSLCLSSRGQLNPLTAALDEVLRMRGRKSDSDSKDAPDDPTKGEDPGSVGKNPVSDEREVAAPAPTVATQPQSANDAEKVKMPAPTPKKSGAKSANKKQDKKTVIETAAAQPAETPEGAGAKTNGEKTNGAKTTDLKGDQK